jgi:hypothetical protein
VFDSAQKFVEQNATRAKRPALVLDIDGTSLTNWPNLLAERRMSETCSLPRCASSSRRSRARS